MTNTKSTKRALLSSVVSLLLCFAMLLGTTYAWFTDSVKSGNNIITSGNLDVELEYATVQNGKMSDWKKVAGSTEIFDPNARWEPGRVEVVYLKVSNLGSLALKYQLGVNVISESEGTNVYGREFKLSEYLVFKVVEMDDKLTPYESYEAAVSAAAGTEKGLKDYNGVTTPLGVNEIDYVAMIVYMPETVDNEANHNGKNIPAIELGINLYATQMMAEDDSFDNTYDEDAWTEGMLVTSAEELSIAIKDVKDGGTVILANNLTFDKSSCTNSGDSWYEGLYYVGDKSFTIDLNGNKITNDSAVNDYLMLFKNIGSKENVITIKNGTLEASSSAYCAICTSTGSTQKITINLENVNVIGNNSNGSVVKIRGGAELNVKAGTIITGTNSYLGIENFGATVNIYDGAEIYQNGTSSYNGCLVGVGGNGTINVHGGYGKGVHGGFIAMTSGGTINVYGGEWIANTDGSYASDNKSVLIAQSADGADSIVNVYGGEFFGGFNCYGNAAGDAQINISSGVFNADPNTYVVDGSQALKDGDGYWHIFPDNFDGVIYNADTLKKAFENGGEYLLTTNVAWDADSTINCSNSVILDLNGNTIAGVSDQTGANKSIIVVGKNGDLTVKNGIVTMEHTGANMGWNNSTNALEAVSGGKLTLDHVNVINLGGSDMAYAVNIANNGGATLKTIASTLESKNYTALRIFNNADGAINVDLTEGTVLTSSSAPFFVHFWTKEDLGDKQATRQAYLTVNFNDTQVSRYSGSISLLRYGFTNAAYYDMNGNQVVVSAEALQAALNNDVTKIALGADITGDVTVTQKPGVKITIDGNGKTFAGVITVDGKSATYTTAGLTIKNVNFKADTISADACINLGVSGNNDTRYTCNVTVDNCTFDVPGAVGVKSYTGGDKNLTITNCTATKNAHSLVQVAGVDGVLVDNCKVYSKNGVNFNQSENVTISYSEFDVTGYAVRFGASSGGHGEAETYTIKNSTLKSANDDGDAVIILRGTADNSTLTVTNTTLIGDIKITDTASNATVIIDGVYYVSSADELTNAVKNGATEIHLVDKADFRMPSNTATVNVTIVGNETAQIDMTWGAYWDNATLTFNGVNIKTGTGYANGNGSDYAALYSPNVTYNNCTFSGPMRVGRDGAKFINCTFNDLGNDYVWTYGNDVSFDGCTFNTDGKAILIYSDGGSEISQVSVTNCTFNATTGAKAGAIANQNCAAIEIHNYGNGVNLTTSGNTYDNNFSGEWRIKTYESGKPGITVNGTEYTTIAIDGKTMTIDANKNVTVND